MFEKEAEEIANKRCHEIMCFGHCSFSSPKHHRCGEWHREYNCAKEGIEFGYNKAKVEVEESYRESLCNSELNLASVTEQLEELEKANEWHYVKDRDYPKDNKPVLCILGDIDSDNCEVGYYNDVGSGEPWHFETYHLPDDDGDNAWGVFAWKEIVLPKESE